MLLVIMLLVSFKGPAPYITGTEHQMSYILGVGGHYKHYLYSLHADRWLGLCRRRRSPPSSNALPGPGKMLKRTMRRVETCISVRDSFLW